MHVTILQARVPLVNSHVSSMVSMVSALSQPTASQVVAWSLKSGCMQEITRAIEGARHVAPGALGVLEAGLGLLEVGLQPPLPVNLLLRNRHIQWLAVHLHAVTC